MHDRPIMFKLILDVISLKAHTSTRDLKDKLRNMNAYNFKGNMRAIITNIELLCTSMLARSETHDNLIIAIWEALGEVLDKSAQNATKNIQNDCNRESKLTTENAISAL